MAARVVVVGLTVDVVVTIVFGGFFDGGGGAGALTLYTIVIANPVALPASSVAVTSMTFGPSCSGMSRPHAPFASAVASTPAMTMCAPGSVRPLTRRWSTPTSIPS